LQTFCVFTSFLGAFENLRKAIMSFVMSVYPTVRPRDTTQLPLDGFSSQLITTQLPLDGFSSQLITTQLPLDGFSSQLISEYFQTSRENSSCFAIRQR